MPEQQAGEKKEGLVDKIFHHGHHKEGEQATSGQQQAAQGQAQQQPRKETEREKFKDYMAEERKLDEEGKEYGGLM